MGKNVKEVLMQYHLQKLLFPDVEEEFFYQDKSKKNSVNTEIKALIIKKIARKYAHIDTIVKVLKTPIITKDLLNKEVYFLGNKFMEINYFGTNVEFVPIKIIEPELYIDSLTRLKFLKKYHYISNNYTRSDFDIKLMVKLKIDCIIYSTEVIKIIKSVEEKVYFYQYENYVKKNRMRINFLKKTGSINTNEFNKIVLIPPYTISDVKLAGEILRDKQKNFKSYDNYMKNHWYKNIQNGLLEEIAVKKYTYKNYEIEMKKNEWFVTDCLLNVKLFSEITKEEALYKLLQHTKIID